MKVRLAHLYSVIRVRRLGHGLVLQPSPSRMSEDEHLLLFHRPRVLHGAKGSMRLTRCTRMDGQSYGKEGKSATRRPSERAREHPDLLRSNLATAGFSKLVETNR